MKALATFLIAIAATVLITLGRRGSVNEPAIEAKSLIKSEASPSCGEGSILADDATAARMKRPDPATVVGYLDCKMMRGGGKVSCIVSTADGPQCRGSGGRSGDMQLLGD